MNMPATSTVTKSVGQVVDAIPFESIPVNRLTDVDIPDVGDAWTDATDFVADSAAVIGKHGSRLAARTVRAAWRNRMSVATVVLVVLAVVGAVSLLKRRADDDTTDR